MPPLDAQSPVGRLRQLLFFLFDDVIAPNCFSAGALEDHSLRSERSQPPERAGGPSQVHHLASRWLRLAPAYYVVIVIFLLMAWGAHATHPVTGPDDCNGGMHVGHNYYKFAALELPVYSFIAELFMMQSWLCLRYTKQPLGFTHCTEDRDGMHVWRTFEFGLNVRQWTPSTRARTPRPDLRRRFFRSPPRSLSFAHLARRRSTGL